MNEQQTITVVIADDHPLFRDGVRQALERDAAIRIVATAGDGEQALRLITEHRPAVAVLDMNMPLRTGLEVIKALRWTDVETAVVVLTMFDDEEILDEAMDLGVTAYILKESASLDIVAAVRAAAEGRYYLSPKLTGSLVRRKERRDALTTVHPGLATLSEQERRVLCFIAEGRSSREIAAEMFLSPKTVDNYRFRMSEKLGLSGSYSLLKFALEHRSEL